MTTYNVFCIIVDLILVQIGLELASGMFIKGHFPLLLSSSFLLRYWSQFLFHILYSPDGQYVAVGGSDGTIYIWEALTGRPHKVKKDSSAHR